MKATKKPIKKSVHLENLINERTGTKHKIRMEQDHLSRINEAIFHEEKKLIKEQLACDSCNIEYDARCIDCKRKL